MSVQNLAPGLWHWQAAHPQWGADDWWPQQVSSYAVDEGGRLLLLDPLEPPAQLQALALERDTLILLTCPWHERSSRDLVRSLNVPIWAPPADPGSPDLSWLDPEQGHAYTLEGGPPGGVAVLPGHRPNDLVLRIDSCDAVVCGDTLVDFGDGLELNDRWLPAGVSREDVAGSLRGLLADPPAHVLATHGGPQSQAALERALASR